MWLLKISLILVDSLLKVGPGKTKKIVEKSWNFLTKKVYEPWTMYHHTHTQYKGEIRGKFWTWLPEATGNEK